MHDNFFIKELGFELDSIPTELLELKESIGVDGIYCSGKFPAVFIKEVPDFKINELKKIAEIQKKIWNNSSVVFLYVVSPNEIRIYNCNATPVFLKKDSINLEKELKQRTIEYCQKSDSQRLSEISQVFSSIAIDSGKIWTSSYSKKIKLLTKVDHYLVDSLLKLAKELHKDIKDDNIIHTLLLRSIFVMYLQDRGAIPSEIWGIIGENDFLKILDNHISTYRLFAEIEKHFNGNVFSVSQKEKRQVYKKHLNLIKHCLIDGEINSLQTKLFPNWRLFDFSLIRIELLSEIYESFLNEFDPIRKKQTGTYYTPPSLVELVLDDVLPKKGTNYNLRILDPACGSGIFLAQAYKRIVRRWKQANKGLKPSFKILSDLLTDNIYGIEENKKSIKVAAFSLYLALLDFLEPRDIWLKENEQFRYLIRDLESEDETDKKGKNLFRTDTIKENGEFEKIEYDLIVGNPPFGTENLPYNIKKYCDEYNFDKQFVIPFIHKSTKLAPKGKIALLFNTKLLTNAKSTSKNFRNWLFNQCYVEKIYNLSILRKAPKDFGGHLFSSAVVPISIVCFQKIIPKKSAMYIEYWAPQTFIKNHVTEGIIIDSTDIKYIPREICRQPETKIWKIAQWGTMADYFLLERIKNITQIKELFKDGEDGVGFQILDRTTKKPLSNHKIREIPFVLPEQIGRYYTNKDKTQTINACIKTKKSKEIYLNYYSKKNYHDLPLIDVFRRQGTEKAFKAPHLLIKKGLKEKKICASFLDYDCSFNSMVFGLYHSNEEILKALVCYFNSNFATYFLFLTSTTWGIERETIFTEEIKLLPTLPQSYLPKLKVYLDIIIEKSKNIFDGFKEEENKINEIINEAFEFSKKDIILIEDIIDYTIPLFFNGEKSKALLPVSSQLPETYFYTDMLCNVINNFLIAGIYKVNASIYKVSPNSPLCLVVINFVNPSKVVKPIILDSKIEFETLLKKINRYSLNKYSQNIYVRKFIRYYDGDTIFIIKPNQKRFWTRSQGIEDAHSIINEIAVSE